MRQDWSREEVEATVADYFAMLKSELRREDYNKSEHRRNLIKVLAGRSETAVERKHMNISAILRDIDHPWIPGYKPYGNYQRLLEDIVLDRLTNDSSIVTMVEHSVDEPANSQVIENVLKSWTEPPEHEYVNRVAEPIQRERKGRRINYLKREAQNRSLGQAGELFVLQLEAERLYQQGKTELADKIEHVSSTQGDGLGFDVLSFDLSGRERLIEVKTTAYGKRTPFYVTINELECSIERSDQYHLYRVFSFRKDPRLFGLNGRLDSCFSLEPFQYVARR